MHRRSDPSIADGQLPVFVFPNSLTFYTDDQTTHKQVLTLYNPYDFSLKFKVLSTAPEKYNVPDPEGTVRPQCCVDIVVRHTAIPSCDLTVQDKFRIQVSEHGHKKVLGRRDVVAGVSPGNGPSQGQSGAEMHTFRSVAGQPGGPQGTHQTQYSFLPQHHGPQQHIGASSPLVAVIAVCCLVALLLPSVDQSISPTSPDGTILLPHWLHLTLHQKLVAAYILGLATMLIIRN